MTERYRLSLDGSWQFFTESNGALDPHDLDRGTCWNVSVPAPWQSQGEGLRHYTGAGWYRRSFNVPENWQGRAVILGFGAADYRAEVWLNGERVGEHEGGYLPFEFDITRLARSGQNTVVVRVEDSPALFPEVPHGKQSWYGQLSGLWQPVWIEARPETHIRQVQVYPGEGEVRAAARLSRPLQRGETLAYEVYSPEGERVQRVETTETEAVLPVPDPALWDIGSPNLYALRVAITGDGGDVVEKTFGFRTIEARGGEILLNGRPIFLRAALDQDYYPELDCTPPSLEYIEDQFRKAMSMGLNCVRVHIKAPDPRYYEAADRLGLLVWTELPNWQVLAPDTRRRALETLEGMVERDGHHPSIIIWTLINESWGLDLTDPAQRRWLADTYDFMKRLDPTRLVVGNSACHGNHHVVTDIEDFHNYYAIPDHHTRWRRWVDSFASRPAWTFARPYKGYDQWREFLRDPWVEEAYEPAPETRRKGDEPLVVSEFGNWGLPDIDKLKQEDGSEPWWFETGFDWGDGIVYPHGIEKRFQAFHLDRAFPDLPAMLAASRRQQYNALKYEIEQMRRKPELKGYVITELTDVHWESNGLMDMNRNLKLDAEEMAALNADDMLAPEWDKLAYRQGEMVEVRLFLSHYSQRDLRGCRLEWQLEGFDGLSGGYEDLNPQPYTVTPLEAVTFPAPEVSRPTRTRLALRLLDREGREIHRNHLELFFFPERETRQQPPRLYAPELAGEIERLGYVAAGGLDGCDAALALTLDDPLREYLLSGGKALWLADRDHAQQTHLGTTRVVPRQGTAWQGDWVSSLSWVNREALFADLPFDGLVDFLFAGLTPDHVITGFGQSEFAHNVQAGITVGWLHRNAALVARRRVGEGRLVISTFNLSGNLNAHPAAAWMLDDLLKYTVE